MELAWRMVLEVFWRWSSARLDESKCRASKLCIEQDQGMRGLQGYDEEVVLAEPSDILAAVLSLGKSAD